MNVYERLASAQANLKAVGKGSTNDFHGYKYTSAEDMLTACRSALLDAGLVCMRDSWSVLEVAGTIYVKSIVTVSCFGTTGDDKAPEFTTIHKDFLYPVCPGNGRPMDKAVSAALTTGLSYWLRDLLLLPRVDGLEVDNRDDSKYQHRDPLSVKISEEIRALATAEQMQKFDKACMDRGSGVVMENIEPETLQRWLDRLLELNAND